MPALRRSSAPGAITSASTTSTVGRRIRCLARSRRREGTVTLIPAAASEATRWRPTKPEPPTTSTELTFIGLLPRLFLEDRRFRCPWGRDDAEARLERDRFLLEHGGVVDGVRHHLLHIVPGLGKGNRLDVDRPFERLLVAPAARTRGAGVVCRRSEHRMAELLHHELEVRGAERDVR